jgi:hypothetical protein
MTFSIEVEPSVATVPERAVSCSKPSESELLPEQADSAHTIKTPVSTSANTFLFLFILNTPLMFCNRFGLTKGYRENVKSVIGEL